ncbi:MAG: methylmalonyl-CoA epimerase [Acidobacteriota bacterium]|jgi:methylmalonyl-CoA/ethylmalonyl-CoA epimerase|nr:methylmalonyl-CoA epimerase [Acidobacteriota bacterium]|tara:strand:+ start:690 stop:1115 length:426 start_codon:yes stop_codon:yes gene_type:complete
MSLIPPGTIDHIGIAVRDLDLARTTYESVLGAELSVCEIVEEQGVKVAFMTLPGATRVELIAPTDGDGAVARFLDTHGEGMHHICITVEDIKETLAVLEEAEVPLVDKSPRRGAEGSQIAFVHPAKLGGVLLELKQKADTD